MRDIASPLDGFASPFGPGRRTLTNLLFGQSEPGFTFEPWDITTLYQDRAGTTPVTAAGQSVGLRLDKSKGLALGAERGAALTLPGWTVTSGVTVSGGVAAFSSAAQNSNAYNVVGTVEVGKTYRVSLTVSSYVSGTAALLLPGGSGRGAITSNGTFTGIYTASSTGVIYLWAQGASNNTFVISDYSVRELAGTHEVAINDAARGIYGWMPKTGRRNLLNATDTLATQSVTVTAAAHTLAFTGTGTVTLSGTSTAGPLVGTGASNRVTLTFTPTAGSLTLTVTGSVTLAQLELGSTDTAYQRVVSNYDITEAGVPSCYYVLANGVNTAYVTPTITPNTDKVQVFAGARKNSDAAIGIFVEHSATIASNNGAFYVAAPITAGAANYHLVSKGTGPVSATYTNAAVAAPVTNVLTGLGDISGDRATLRVNGTQVAQSTADQGTGNYLAYPAYIYARGGTTLPFNGYDFGHAERFGPNLDAATIALVESLIARNTPEVTL